MAGKTGKKSSRAQKEDYTPVSEKNKGTSSFVPNGELPANASDMDKAAAAAKKADMARKNELLKRLKEEQSGE
jgi:hypothetical protein